MLYLQLQLSDFEQIVHLYNEQRLQHSGHQPEHLHNPEPVDYLSQTEGQPRINHCQTEVYKITQYIIKRNQDI